MAKEVSKGQELVDASRLIKSGVRTDDPQTREVSWKRLRKIFGGGKSKRVYDSLLVKEEVKKIST